MTGAVRNFETLAIIQLARFGDLVQTSALLQNLKTDSGCSRSITLFVDERNTEIASLLEGVDHVVGIPLQHLPSNINSSIKSTYDSFKQWYQTWYDGRKYDSLILLNQGILPATIGQMIAAKEKQGPFSNKTLPGPHWYLNRALADRSCNPINLYEIWAAYGPGVFPLPLPALKNDVLGTPFAVTSIEEKLRASKNNNIAINLGAGAAGRTPSKEKLAVLIDMIIKNGERNVVLLGKNSERQTAEFLLKGLDASSRNRVFDFTGKTTIPQLASLLGVVELLVTVDTGTIHLAAATGTKILGLFFAGANPFETGPYSHKAVILVHKHTLDQDENGSVSDPLGHMDMQKLYSLMQRMMKNEASEKEIENGFDPFVLYMARPSSMGIEYGSVSEKDHLPFGKARRWLPQIRRTIWGEKFTFLQSAEASDDSESIRNNLDKVHDFGLKMWLENVLVNEIG